MSAAVFGRFTSRCGLWLTLRIIKLRLLRDTTPLQRGIIRHLTLLLDLSSAMSEKDLRPTRYILALRESTNFVRRYFEQNPISQLAIIGTRDGLAFRVSNMSGTPAVHITALQKLMAEGAENGAGAPSTTSNSTGKTSGSGPSGSPSLQNGLDLARAGLAATPSHGTREILIVWGALITADPGDIHSSIRNLVSDHIRVSVVGMAARLAICSELVAKTHGLPSASSSSGVEALYGVAMQEEHFRNLLIEHTTPPATRATEQATRAPSLLTMGFPSRIDEAHASLCACHARPSVGGFLCTRCSAKVCGLPMQCPTCGLQLVQSTHLARSYHHLFPLKNYIEVSWDGAKQKGSESCFGCLLEFPAAPRSVHGPGQTDGVSKARRKSGAKGAGGAEPPKGASESSRYACTSCGEHFCIDCDVYNHDILHNCAGCLSRM